VPVEKMLEGERAKLLQMEDRLRERVVGQRRRWRRVRRRCAAPAPGLKDPARPIGSFLFLGPTGVGKTELDQGAGRIPVRRRGGRHPPRHERVHGEAQRQPHDRRASRLRRLRRGRRADESVRRRPYQVVLFDEVEKAHPDVFNICCQVLDDGRLTDGQGRTVDFRNTLIIMTSNMGAEHLAALPDGADVEEARPLVMNVVRATSAPSS
jgi:ATP-dependent Clp protease ATP-binding subunit ClpB